jgi:catechol-2,3-dioxygenase
MRPTASFSHAGMFVRNIDVMVSFYQRVIGLTITDRGELNGVPIVFLSANPTEHHQIVLTAGRPQEPHFNPINQLSFRLAGFSELRTMLGILQTEGVAQLSPVSHGNALSIYFLDPEGNRIELFIDTPWYVDQPLRVPIDLDRNEDEVWGEVEASARELAGYRPVEVWQAEMTQRMRSGFAG